MGSCGRPSAGFGRRAISRRGQKPQRADVRRRRAKPALPRWTRWLSGSRRSRLARETAREAWIARDLERRAGCSAICGMSAAPRSRQLTSAAAELGERAAQGGRSARGAEHLDRSAVRGENVLRQIDAVEAAIILGAILKVVDHLQRRAQCVGGGPGRLVLVMHVEDEAADRRRREPAIIHQFRPVGVAALAHVETERVEQIEGVSRAEAALAQGEAQRLGFGSRGPPPQSASPRSSSSASLRPPKASDDRRRRRRPARSDRRRGWGRGGARSSAMTRQESSRRDGSCRRASRSQSSCAPSRTKIAGPTPSSPLTLAPMPRFFHRGLKAAFPVAAASAPKLHRGFRHEDEVGGGDRRAGRDRRPAADRKGGASASGSRP